MAVMLWLAAGQVGAQKFIQFVQPLAGTAPASTISAIKHSEAGSTEKNANTIPTVGLPFGMTQWVAQTRGTETKCIPPYMYRDSLWMGFRGTHWISGSCMQDYGSLTITPVAGSLKTRPAEIAMPMRHDKETSSPAYYKMEGAAITSEATATARCGLLRFTPKKADSLYLLVLPNSDEGQGFVKVDGQRGVVYGYNPVHRIYQGWGQPAGFNGYFYLMLNKPFTVHGTYDNEGMYGADSIKNRQGGGAYIGLLLQPGEAVEVAVGTSFTSLEGAMRNLQQETQGLDFDMAQRAAESGWNQALGKISVATKDEKKLRIFYTSLYHALQHPRLYNDVDGTYPMFAQQYQNGHVGSRDYYDDFSMWDIYRAQLPLITLLDERRTADFAQSLVWKGQQGGWLPIFPCWNSYTAAMIGDHATAFLASVYARGIQNFDVTRAYHFMRKNAFEMAGDKDYSNGMGRRALTSYVQYGYVPVEDSVPHAFHKKEQVSRTLEYAYDDYALATMARQLGKQNDYHLLQQRSRNYQNVFDPTCKMVNARYANGSWFKPVKADCRDFFITEGTPRQYTFYVPHDVPGLARLMGGRHALEKQLDSLVAKGEYWHGNEPGHQIPFLYNYTSSPWKTQQLVSDILNEEYGDGEGGLSGNDDAGQMSAWYVFAAIGFYPVDPVSGNYVLTTPQFDSVTLQLPTHKTFTVVCHGKRSNGKYIDRITLNGKPYTKNYLKHADIVQGGRLQVWLRATPGTWGSQVTNQPPGLPNGKW